MKDSIDAKKKMLLALRKEMMSSDDMGLPKHLNKLQKVTVAADNKADLSKGLDKAKELLQKRSKMLGLPEDSEEECLESPEEEASESPEEELSEEEPSEESPEALKAEIERLKAQLAEKK